MIRCDMLTEGSVAARAQKAKDRNMPISRGDAIQSKQMHEATGREHKECQVETMVEAPSLRGREALEVARDHTREAIRASALKQPQQPAPSAGELPESRPQSVADTEAISQRTEAPTIDQGVAPNEQEPAHERPSRVWPSEECGDREFHEGKSIALEVSSLLDHTIIPTAQ